MCLPFHHCPGRRRLLIAQNRGDVTHLDIAQYRQNREFSQSHGTNEQFASKKTGACGRLVLLVA